MVSRFIVNRRSVAAVFAITTVMIAPVNSSLGADDGVVVARVGDASITHHVSNGLWLLAAGGATLSLALDATRNFSVLDLTSPSGHSWIATAATDTSVKAGSKTFAFGSRQAGFVLEGVTVATTGSALQLNATFDLVSAGLRMTRHYAMVSGSPSFEAWNTYAALGATASLTSLSALELTIPAGNIRWLNGLQGDNAGADIDSAFSLRQKTLAVGQQFTVGATYRASEHTVPWFAIDGAGDEFYSALMWSGAWSLVINRTTAGLALTFGLGTMQTTTSTSVDGPHVVFGVATGGSGRGECGAAIVYAQRHSRRSGADADGDLQHLVRVRRQHRRGLDAGRNGQRCLARRRVVRHGRGMVSRRGR